MTSPPADLVKLFEMVYDWAIKCRDFTTSNSPLWDMLRDLPKIGHGANLFALRAATDAETFFDSCAQIACRISLLRASDQHTILKAPPHSGRLISKALWLSTQKRLLLSIAEVKTGHHTPRP